MVAMRFLPRLASLLPRVAGESAAIRIAGEGGVLAEEEVPTAEEIVASNKQAWQELTHNSPSASSIFELGQSLSGKKERAIIAHGWAHDKFRMNQGLIGAERVNLSGLGRVGPNTLAEILAQSGWEGEHIRLMACSTGTPSEQGILFGEQVEHCA